MAVSHISRERAEFAYSHTAANRPKKMLHDERTVGLEMLRCGA